MSVPETGTGHQAAIELRGVDVTIKRLRANMRAGFERTTLLSNVDLTVSPGEWVSIIGPNGAGKSTMLGAIAGLVRASGTVMVHGQSIRELPPRERARLTSWVPQTPTIPAGITVFDYVLLGRTPHLHPLARERASDLAIVTDVLGQLDLDSFARRMVDTLSGGELQRAVIGRALAQQSPIILLDEPTSALDLGHQQDVLTLLDDLRSTGARTIVTTMHDLTLAGVFTDRLVLLSQGAVVSHGSAADVLTQDNLERYYGAKVTVTRRDGRVLVTPCLSGRN